MRYFATAGQTTPGPTGPAIVQNQGSHTAYLRVVGETGTMIQIQPGDEVRIPADTTTDVVAFRFDTDLWSSEVEGDVGASIAAFDAMVRTGFAPPPPDFLSVDTVPLLVGPDWTDFRVDSGGAFDYDEFPYDIFDGLYISGNPNDTARRSFLVQLDVAVEIEAAVLLGVKKATPGALRFRITAVDNATEEVRGSFSLLDVVLPASKTARKFGDETERFHFSIVRSFNVRPGSKYKFECRTNQGAAKVISRILLASRV